MKAQTRGKENLNKAKGLKISLGIHLAIMIAALMPMISSTSTQTADEAYIIPIEFAELSSSANEGMQARSIKPAPVPTPVVDKEEPKPSPVEAPEVVEETQIIEETEEIESEIVEESVEEVAASEDQVEANDEISASEGGSNETNVTGEQEGTETDGDESGLAGLDGDGVLTRRIIYRQDITQVAEQDGVIAINVCIDRQGKVSAAKFNEDHTTIEDKELIRRALNIAAEYRFEVDFST